MESLILSEIATAVNGEISHEKFNNVPISSISTDSRKDILNGLFVPIKGERFDGHEYIQMAFEKGAVCALSEHKFLDEKHTFSSEKPIIFVSDTKKALKDLAEYYLSLFNIPVIAVTGSVGKTTTKDLIHSVLSVKYKTLKNQGNLNNEIGLPLTVFELDRSHGAVVLEMGMNAFGEIHNLSKIARPDIAVITNIGHAHIEMLGSREGIFKAKTEIFDYLKENGIIILNGDDDMLSRLKETRKNVILYGIESHDKMHDKIDIYSSNIKTSGLSSVTFTVKSRLMDFDEYLLINSPGKHMVSNALVAVAVGMQMGLTPAEIATGISMFQPSSMRMNILTHDNGLTLINDAYNANPDSMKVAIDVLSGLKTRTVCILGDMLELGSHSDNMHFDIGAYAADKNISLIICVGTLAKHIYDGAINEINKNNLKCEACYFSNKKELYNSLEFLINKNDSILVKASRSMGFEDIIQFIKNIKNMNLQFSDK